METKNLFTDIPGSLPEEWSQVLARSRGVTVERIVSMGDRSPDGFWYDQAWDEWVAVLQGAAGLEFEEGPAMVKLGAGDHLLIPAHARHRVAWTSEKKPTVWLAVHFKASAQPAE
jgi:cupin 2 domain-containing protein